jgi:hypothetical protein
MAAIAVVTAMDTAAATAAIAPDTAADMADGRATADALVMVAALLPAAATLVEATLVADSPVAVT